ncbi:hypothetical protein VTG60DRAFT_683 [Thermothelomyces hinnuleus]
MVVSKRSQDSVQPIAIVGMGCRFPGGVTKPSKLWDLCVSGKDVWSPIPKDRFDLESWYDPDSEKPGRTSAVGGYFMTEDVTRFDAGFFNLSADVASSMDPQIRLLLETVYEATEDAGIPLEKLAGSNTSVFTGIFGTDYQGIQLRETDFTNASFSNSNMATMHAGRVSHFYDLQGPSMTIDTGCSAGLVALHQGCQSIRSGESDLSVIGASNVMLSQDLFIGLTTLGAAGPSGRCYAWDERAHGYGRGEGVAVLILKPLDAALRDGDRVHAVIRESGVNQDGKTNTVTSPSMEAQIKLIESCYKRAGLNMSETGYVEGHMTGTQVGDPTEAEAIARTFGKHQTGEPILVGSVKTNIGHTEAVSGLASIIKTVFVLKHRQIPPNLNYEKPNPKIKLDEWHLQVPTRLTSWPQGKPLRASINNFGYGGTNAHVILESPPPIHMHVNGLNVYQANGLQESDRYRVYVLSAKDSTACQQMAKNLAAYLRAQWYAMGRELITAYPVFGAAVHRAGQILKDFGASWSLYHELMRDEASSLVNEINMAMPMCVALQLCLVDLLKSWGITPTAVTSHSSGEFAAAYSVGALSFKEALGLIYFRGELALQLQKQSTTRGGMLAAGIGPEEARAYIENAANAAVVIACINSPESVTLAGDVTALDEIASRLKEKGLFARRLKVPLAFHSPAMVSMGKEYRSILRTILAKPREWNSDILLTSAVTGGVVTPDDLTEDHWVDNITNPVRFVEAFESMCFGSLRQNETSAANVDVVVEIGPHSTLAGPIRQILNGRKMGYVSVLKRSVDALETAQECACELLARGYPVNLQAVNLPFGPEVQRFTPDLPLYPWNHQSQYWVESRVSREMRHKKFPPHELLGSPVAGGTGPGVTWRKFLKMSQLPWLADHQVESKVVLPGAAYVTMAIEAARLLSEPASVVRAYRLRTVNIMNALNVPESPREVEVHTRLRQCNESELDHRGWYEFEISSMDEGGTWVKNCTGFVAPDVDSASKSALFRDPEPPRADTFFAVGAKVRKLNVPSLYAMMRGMNIYHGPSFQNILDGLTTGDKSITHLSIPGVACETVDYIIHPTTLDTIVQTAFSGFTKEKARDAMFLPRTIGSLVVPSDLKRQAGSKLRAFVEVRKSDRRGFASDIAVSGADGSEASSSLLQMKDFFCQAVPSGPDSGAAAGEQDSALTGKSHWEVDISHRVPAAIKDSMRIILSDSEAELETKFFRCAYNFIYEAVAKLRGQEREGWAWHHKIYYDWMEHTVALGESGSLAPGSKAWSRTSKGMKQMLCDEISSAGGATGKLIQRIGQNLPEIVRGEITPLELMMEGNLLNDYYMEMPALKDRAYRQLGKLVELYAVKNPGANVLEIGAGTGGATQTVLEGFAARGDGSGSLIGHYTFTDVSSGFFEAARQKLAAWQGTVDFVRLDIEADPTDQSFAAGSYDLIVASMVLHATADLHRTMSNVRKLLKPGGKLMMIEAVHDRVDQQMIFGTLPGWWLSQEPFRRWSPNAPLDVWDNVLKATGFTGVDFDISHCEQEEYANVNVIMSAAAATPSYPSHISIVYTTEPPRTWTRRLVKAIQDLTGVLPSVEAFGELSDVQDKVYIFTAEMNAPFVDGIDSVSFEKLRNLLVNSRGVLWLSCGSIFDAMLPEYWQTLGLLRTLRLENQSNRYVHLDFEHSADPWLEDKIDYITHAIQHGFDDSKEYTEIEWEYAVKDSTLYVPRVYGENHPGKNSDPTPELQPFLQDKNRVAWEPPKSNLLSDICFRAEPNVPDDVPTGMVEIEARAFGLNFRDVMVALGQLEDTLVAHECAGIITRLGPDTEQSGLRVGDRVCALAKGRFANFSFAPWTSVCRLPDDMSWEQGAPLSIVYHTAYYSLVEVGRLRKGETVLIHAAAGGVGQAAIVVAQHVGAEIFVTCSTEAKKELLIKEHRIDPGRIWSSRDTSFAPAVMAATGGRGVDVVLNSLSGPMLKATWSCIARFGRFVEIGKVDIEAARLMDMTPFGRCASYSGVDLLQLSEYQPMVYYEALKESVRICHERIKQGKSTMCPVEVYPMSALEKAMRKMQSGGHAGKIILVPRAEDQVKAIYHPRPLSLANRDATYLVVGGLGGVGRSIAFWMIEKGAKNIVLVSRNAESHPRVADLVHTAKADGCNLRIRNCDVTSESELAKLLEYCSTEQLPPVKGVINCAMVLDDSILENMTFEQWQRAIRPKVASTTNLDKHLPDLSFFVMLSSLVGPIGHASQSNYAAGNAFQEGVARRRAAAGKPAVTLDLCGITDVGYVAEVGGPDGNISAVSRVQARVQALGSTFLDMQDVLAHIEEAVLGSPTRRPGDSQAMLGLIPWDRLTDEQPVHKDRRFGTLRLASTRGRASGTGDSNAGGGAKGNQSGILARALLESISTRLQAVAEAVASRLAVIFNIKFEDVDLGTPLVAYGVDSLVAVELRNWLSSAAKAKVSIFEILQSSSVMQFAGLILERSQVIAQN